MDVARLLSGVSELGLRAVPLVVLLEGAGLLKVGTAASTAVVLPLVMAAEALVNSRRRAIAGPAEVIVTELDIDIDNRG